jgi:lipid-binding SYLF domain-containing protein
MLDLGAEEGGSRHDDLSPFIRLSSSNTTFVVKGLSILIDAAIFVSSKNHNQNACISARLSLENFRFLLSQILHRNERSSSTVPFREFQLNESNYKEYSMKKLSGLVAIAALSAAAVPALAGAGDDTQKIDSRLDAAKEVITQIMSVPDKAVPNQIAHKAECVGVVPGMKKGAFIVGGDYGQGVVTCRTASGWSAPVFIRMEGGSWGLQVGGQSTDLILVAMNDKGFQDLLHSKFKIGGDASAAAGPVGRDAQASTDLSLHAELLTWSRSRGAFAGIDLNGTSVTQNKGDTDAFYGSSHAFDDILHGSVPPPTAAQGFLDAVTQYFGGSARASR